jgi:hypothetical protein
MSVHQITRIFILTVFSVFGSMASADEVFVLGSGHGSINNAINDLNTLGYSVTNSNTPLADYSAYDQVWDLRYSVDVSAPDRSAFDDYLGGGGRMYITGENGTFDGRNNSINTFLNQIGAGGVGLASNTFEYENQTITAAGQVVNNPNDFTSISTYYGRRVVAPGSGFLVSESNSNPGTGSLVGWDFGDLPNHPDSRMLIGYDIELFDNGVDWTENVATYLGTSAVPEPGMMPMWILGAASLGLVRRRGKLRTTNRSFGIEPAELPGQRMTKTRGG